VIAYTALQLRRQPSSMHTYIVSSSSVGSMFACGVGGWGSISSNEIFLISMSVMALETIKFNLFFNFLHLFILFLPLFRSLSLSVL
jgi:hypothetical protein